MSNHPLTADEQEALDELLPPDRRSGDHVEDLVEAAREARRRRANNTKWGGLVIGALHRELDSWRRLAAVTGIPLRTARNWSTPPPGTGKNTS
jgi:hypothetical protein